MIVGSLVVLVVWLFGCLVVWLFGRLGVWLFGRLGVWLFGRLVVWLKSVANYPNQTNSNHSCYS